MSISTQAAVTVATSLGIECHDPVVLHDGANVVVHLRPAPVVARVAGLVRTIRPGVEAWLTRDVLVARHLAAKGVPVTRPWADPVVTADDVVALWHHEPHYPSARPSPEQVAALLADLHEAMRDYPGELPRFGPCGDIAHALEALSGTLPAPVLALLRAENDRLREEIAPLPAQPLHGDAHPGNMLVTPSGPVWNDFEDTWFGPVGWDLACLWRTSRLDGQAAVAAYPGPTTGLAPCLRLRALMGVVWPFILATRCPAKQAHADERLRAWLAEHGHREDAGDHQ